MQIRIDLWIAANLIPNGSIVSIVENYKRITGDTISEANCKRLMATMDDALKEVDSKHVLKW